MGIAGWTRSAVLEPETHRTGTPNSWAGVGDSLGWNRELVGWGRGLRRGHGGPV